MIIVANRTSLQWKIDRWSPPHITLAVSSQLTGVIGALWCRGEVVVGDGGTFRALAL